MKQTWKYMKEDYEVDTEDRKSYSRIIRDMVDYNDCYDSLDEFVTNEIGSGADLLLLMIWDGAQYTAVRLLDRFVMWMVNDHMDTVRELLETNAMLVSEKEGAEE